VCRIGLGLRVRVRGIHEERVAMLRSWMPVVKTEDEDLKPYLPLGRISTCRLAQGACTKFVYRVVSDVNIMFCTLISLYGNDIIL
jgi:hypothetical protein